MADVTISDLSPLTPSTGLVLPVSNGSTTGSVTLSQVCGVMTSAQITTALGYTPYNSTNPNGYITNTNASVAKAWVNFNGTGTSPYSIRAQYNVTQVVGGGATGLYRIYFATSMPDVNYMTQVTPGIQGGTGSSGQGVVTNQSIDNVLISMRDGTGSPANNQTQISVLIFR